jgi:hypothetical protein
MSNVRSVAWKGVKGKSLFRLCSWEPAARYPKRYCTFATIAKYKFVIILANWLIGRWCLVDLIGSAALCPDCRADRVVGIGKVQ